MAKYTWTSDERITKTIMDQMLYGSANGESADDLTKLAIKDQSGAGSYATQILIAETLTADRALTLKLNDAARTVDLGGNLTLAGAFTTVGAFGITLTATNTTALTLPTTGTLATLLGTEIFQNKTLQGATLTGTLTCTTQQISMTTGNLTISGAGYVSIGANAASAGYIRLSNAQYINARNAAASGDVNMIQVSANDYVKLGTASVEIATTNVVTLTFSNPAATRTITFADPGGADSVTYLAATQTLSGKTLTAPTINAGALSGTFSGTPTLSGATITLTGNTLNLTAGGAYTLGTTDNNILVVKTNAVNKFAFTATLGQFTVYQTTANYTLAFSDPAAGRVVTFPDPGGADSVCYIAATQNISGKTYTGATLPITAAAAFTTGTTDNNTYTIKTNNVDKFVFSVTLGQFAVKQTTADLTLIFSNPAAARNITFADPLGHDSVVYLAATQSLSGKTLSLTGNLTFASALDIVVQAATAVALELSDGSTKLLAVDTRVAVDNVEVHTWTAPAPTFAAAAGSTWIHHSVGAATVTLTGNIGVTAMSGLQLYLGAPTIASAGTPAVALASTLYVAAPVAGGTATITAGYSAHFASQIRVDGNVNIAAGAVDLVVKADTAATFEIYDATTKILAIDSRVTTDNIVGITLTGPAVTVAAAAGTTYSMTKVAARTHTLTGNTGVTAMSGLQLYLDAPTITSAGTPAVALASTLYVAAPAAAGTATITAGYSAHFASQVRIDGNLSLANAGYDVMVKADTAACLEIYDSTTKLLTINDQVSTDNVVMATFTGAAPTFASAAGSTYSVLATGTITVTVTGGVGVTAMSGLGLKLGAPTVTSAAATTVALASTLYVAAPVAAGAGPVSFTASYSGHFASQVRLDGNLSMANAAYDLVIKADTAVALELSDGTNKLLAVDTRTTTDNVVVNTWTAPAPTFVSAAGSTWRHHSVAAVTVTVTGGIGVTAMNGLQMYLATPTLAAGQATTVGIASTLYLQPPALGANMTITNNYMINTSVAGCFLTAAGVWTDASSVAHKKDIKAIKSASVLASLKDVPVVTYKRKDFSDGGYQRYGLIAEDAPDFLRSSDGMGVAPGYVAGYALAVAKALQEENKLLKQRVSDLEARIA